MKIIKLILVIIVLSMVVLVGCVETKTTYHHLKLDGVEDYCALNDFRTNYFINCISGNKYYSDNIIFYNDSIIK